MSTSALKGLVIGHLRGSVVPFTLPFEKGKKLTVIYGENATGKTTICDAFEFLANGKVGSLEDRGLGKTTKYWHSLGRSAADVSVKLETGDSSCTARIQKGEVVAVPAAARPRVRILRRSQILRVIEEQPARRYAEISRFIDVSGVETSEAALRDLIRDQGRNRDTAVRIVQENETAIGQFWESDGKLGNDSIKWAENVAAQDVSGLAAEQQALATLRTSYQRLADYPEKIVAAKHILNAAVAEAKGAATNLEGLLATVAEGAGEIVAILEAAKSYFQKHPDPPQCPLCESVEKVAGLRERVGSRIAQLASVQKGRREKLVADQSVQAAERKLADIRIDLAGDIQKFEAAKTARQWRENILLPKQPCSDDLGLVADWLKSSDVYATEWQQTETAMQDQSRFVTTLKRALETYKANVRDQKELDQLLPRLERALEIAVDERRKFTDGILKAISAKVGELYEAVHPGEGLNKISLELDPNRRASLDIGASFGGQDDTPPQAYFSQSHLDTLGLCIFLALASLDSPAETTLVLDDVLASADEPHVERVIEMLHSEVARFRHCVITTHYRPWKEKLRWGWLQNGQCHFVELTKWTTAEGLKLIQSLPDVERLRKLLAEKPPDPQLVCSKAGVILEAALDFLTHLYECRVPRRLGGQQTIGDLLPSLNKRLLESLRVEVLGGRDTAGAPIYNSVELAPILKELTRIGQARNVFGAHFKTLSFELLEGDAIGFGEQVLLLMDALTDPVSGWPRNAKSGSYWATADESRRLHPLRQPA